jgi:hypothetical protein
LYPGLSDTNSKLADARDNANPLGHADCAACVQQIKQMGALQRPIVGRQDGEAFALSSGAKQFEKALALAFVQLKLLPQGVDVR